MQPTEHMSGGTEAQRMRLVGADPYLTKSETAAMRGVSIATLDRMVKRGLFPPGDWASPGRRGWRLSVVQAVPSMPPPAAPKGGKIEPSGVCSVCMWCE